MEKNGTQTALAERFDGKHFNSPNDLAIRKNGDVYFTDPPYGLANFNDSPLKELPHNGVYRVDQKGEVTLLISDLTWPNGIAFSPDEKILYVAVSDPGDPRIMAYEVQSDGTVANGAPSSTPNLCAVKVAEVTATGLRWTREVTSGLPVPAASSCSILLANILAPFSQTRILATAVGATTAVPSTSPPTGSLFA